jgi:signal peptidase I
MNRRTEAANTLACELIGETVRSFGGVRFGVYGTSMTPAIRPGDLVSVERAAVSEASLGEIVVFRRHGRLIVHRVVVKCGGRGEALLVTRGDRMRRDDGLVSSAELIGRVTHIERNHRRVPAPSRLRLTERVICGLLRFSDRATCFYLRLAPRWDELFPVRPVRNAWRP